MSRKALLVFGAVLIIASAELVPQKGGETMVTKGYHESDLSVARDRSTGLPLENPVKGPIPEDASPRGGRL